MAETDADNTELGQDEPWAPWRSRIDAARRRRKDLIWLWRENVKKRRSSATETTGDAEKVSINQDWPLTKAKLAQLYSQTPEVRLTPRYGGAEGKPNPFQKVMADFARELNQTIEDTSIGSTIEEVLADVINASGIGGVIVYCEKRYETRMVPVDDPALLTPDVQQAIAMGLMQPPTMPQQVPVDVQYLGSRLGPGELLIPSDFTGSNYDHARWLGREGRLTWPQAVLELGLTDDQKDDVLGGDKRNDSDYSLNDDSTKFRDTQVVNFTEIFYWRHFYHSDETNFRALQRLVMVDGLDTPVIDEPYAAQQRMPDGKMAGVLKNPIRILTLTYISDDCFPPSDSSIGRYQVNELEDSRDAMHQQRKHSIPIRWADGNRLGPNQRNLLEKGTHQGFIITNGPGDRAVGEVARASYPQERFEFDRVIKSDLTEIWQVGTNQAGGYASGERSAREAGIIEKNFQRRVGQEQDKVAKFFIGVAEVLAGHLAVYGQFALPDELGEQRALVANSFVYSIRVDSTVRMNAEERIEQLMRFLNMTAQSGHVNVKPIIEEIAELSGLDPMKVVVDPQPKPPEPIKISIGSAEDVMNPIFLALTMRTDQGPKPEDVNASFMLIEDIAKRMNAMRMGLPSAGPMNGKSNGQGALPPGGPEEPPAIPGEVVTPEIANPDWQAAARIDRRSEDGGL